ncbi:MAG TPA: M20/M25/M40 family metallo-hydrolase [Thermoanaerobaculia bacterium]|nr:M20/M25/M40 family metallo-hydrolase [Thermoanaerobaculia bacterium]
MPLPVPDRSGQSSATKLFSLALLAIFALTLVDARGPAPLSRSQSAGGFSAIDAAAILDTIAGQGETRASGTAGHDIARDRIVTMLRQWGYEPEVDTRFACNRRGACAWVQNIVALLPGRQRSASVLVSSHYDTVAAGSGASDDGAGTAAALEIARLLKSERTFERDIVFLFADGEEAGLLGAEAFIRFDPHAAAVQFVVNLEARGTAGRAFLFETSRINSELIRLAGRHIPRPATSSLFQTIYERLPNDTDFSVYKRAGKQGVNFGFIGNPSHYHTPLDNVPNTSLRSIQQLGEGALGMTRALASRVDESRKGRGNAVFFELFSRVLFRWPETWAVPMAAATLVGVLFLIAYLRKRGGSRLGRILAATAALIVAVAAAVLVGAIVSLCAGRLLGTQWVSQAGSLITFFWLLPLAVVTYVASHRWVGRSDQESWLAALLLWTILALVAALVLPGASYLFIVPAALSLLAGCITIRGGGSTAGGGTLLLAAALIVFPLAWTLYDGMGIPAMTVVVALVILVVIAGSFLFARMLPVTLRRFSASTAAIAAVALFAALSTAPFSASSPRRLNLQYVVDVDRKLTNWIVTAPSLPPRLIRSASFHRRRVQPWSDIESFEASAPMRSIQSGIALSLKGNQRHAGRRALRLALRATPGTPRVVLAFHDLRAIERITVNGWNLEGDTLTAMRRGDWTLLGIRDVSRRPNTIEIVSGNHFPFDFVIQEIRFGLPDGSESFVRARDDSLATASSDGDVTVLSRRGTL